MAVKRGAGADRASNLSLSSHLSADSVTLALRRDVLDGLSQKPKSLPPRWFYDAVGSELFDRITIAERTGDKKRCLDTLVKVELLIIDDWFLTPPTRPQVQQLHTLIDRRHKTASTIYCTQLPPGQWHDRMEEKILLAHCRGYRGRQMPSGEGLGVRYYRAGTCEVMKRVVTRCRIWTAQTLQMDQVLRP